MSAVTRTNSAVLLCYLPLRFEFVGNNSATKRDLDRVAILPEINMVNSLLFLPAFFVLSIRPYKKRVFCNGGAEGNRTHDLLNAILLNSIDYYKFNKNNSLQRFQ